MFDSALTKTEMKMNSLHMTANLAMRPWYIEIANVLELLGGCTRTVSLQMSFMHLFLEVMRTPALCRLIRNVRLAF